jgi:effector-binding domain-containing protein
MAEIDVRIANLEPMRVASAFGFGEQPETLAWTKILAWASAQGYEDLGKQRFFGFNNPSPSPGSPNYGYEQWMTGGAEVVGNDDIEIKEFPGGLYAVTRSEGLQNISENWMKLAVWREDSNYKTAHHQWLEECFTPRAEKLEDYVFDLFAPIVE